MHHHQISTMPSNGYPQHCLVIALPSVLSAWSMHCLQCRLVNTLGAVWSMYCPHHHLVNALPSYQRLLVDTLPLAPAGQHIAFKTHVALKVL